MSNKKKFSRRWKTKIIEIIRREKWDRKASKREADKIDKKIKENGRKSDKRKWSNGRSIKARKRIAKSKKWIRR